jgi:hypothetical protein
MNQYNVFLSDWGLNSSLSVQAESIAKAKGQYIKQHLNDYINAGYPRNAFFKAIKCRLQTVVQ